MSDLNGANKSVNKSASNLSPGFANKSDCAVTKALVARLNGNRLTFIIERWNIYEAQFRRRGAKWKISRSFLSAAWDNADKSNVINKAPRSVVTRTLSYYGFKLLLNR